MTVNNRVFIDTLVFKLQQSSLNNICLYNIRRWHTTSNIQLYEVYGIEIDSYVNYKTRAMDIKLLNIVVRNNVILCVRIYDYAYGQGTQLIQLKANLDQ